MQHPIPREAAGVSGGADRGKAAGAGRRGLRPQGLRPKAVRIRLGVETRHAVLVTYRAVMAVIAVYPRSMPLISQEFVYTRSRVTQPEAPSAIATNIRDMTSPRSYLERWAVARRTAS